MINLRKQVSTILKTYHSNIHFQKSTDDTDFIYITYDFPNTFKNGKQEIFNLDVDIYDSKDDTTDLETITTAIWKGLDYHRHNDKNMQFSIYQDNRLPPLDEKEKNVKRRKLIFELRYFDKN